MYRTPLLCHKLHTLGLSHRGGRSWEEIDKKGEEELKDEAPKDEIKEGEVNEMKEKHHLYDDRLLNMGLGKVLDFIKGKDPKAYADIEKYIDDV